MQTSERQRQDGFRRTLRALRTQDDVRKLTARIDELEAECAWLRGLLAPTILTPPEWQLTPTEQRLLSPLLHQRLVSAEKFFFAMYTANGRDEPECGLDIIKAVLSSVRRKLRPLGVTVHNRVRQGWYIEPADRARLRAQMLSDEA